MQSVQPLPQHEEAAPGLHFPPLTLLSSERALIGAHIFVAMAALSLGVLLGPFQTFRRAPALQWDMPIFSYYYQALTAHGVLNALVFTTFFIMGASYFVFQRSLQRPLKSVQGAWVAFGLMVVGMVLAAGAIIGGQSNVLYTFYPPMEAHWTFYLGLTLVVVGSWLGLAIVLWTYFAWRKENVGKAVPLAAYAILANFIMWFSATLGVAIEILTMLLPMSLGLIDTTDAQVARILFWFFGHPLVYFWLIPAYVSWYTMLPKQLGVKLFSDPLARVAFLFIMIFSIPIGVHHLFVDPGVSESAKLMHTILTFVVSMPSLLTAFNIAATMERAGRKRGAKGALDWMWKLPWGNPVIAAQFLGMLLFVIGGVTGIMNASFNLNVALHNTTWVVGHFHTTLGGAVFLTYMSILFWILPMLRGRKLWMPQLALAHVYLWFIGMVIFGTGMGRAGIEGAIRRTDLGGAGAYISDAVAGWLNLSAVAGVILLISSICLYAVILGTLFLSKEPVEQAEPPVETEAPKGVHIPAILENWTLWAVVIVFSNLIMWGPVLLSALNLTQGFWAVGNPGAAQ
ncbi:MAG: b(o/a)3-type cytochrome-c oxidase subunit 1 [Anaerolineae bacterium]